MTIPACVSNDSLCYLQLLSFKDLKALYALALQRTLFCIGSFSDSFSASTSDCNPALATALEAAGMLAIKTEQYCQQTETVWPYQHLHSHTRSQCKIIPVLLKCSLSFLMWMKQLVYCVQVIHEIHDRHKKAVSVLH